MFGSLWHFVTQYNIYYYKMQELFYYKMRQKFITKYGRLFITNATVLLEIAAVITKCVDFI